MEADRSVQGGVTNGWHYQEVVIDHLCRVSNEKIDSHRFSGLASRCVEWFDPNIKRTNREAPSPSFLQEKIKTLEITGRS